MKTLAFIDTETSSLDHATGRLLEVAVALWSVEHRSLISARSWLLEGQENEAEAVNGIPAALLSRGMPAEEVERQIHNILVKECDAVVAYNVEFDRAWFSPEIQKAKPWICAMDDVEYPRATSSKSLTAVALAHGVGVVHAHRAEADVLTMVETFRSVARDFDLADGGSDRKSRQLLNYINRQTDEFRLEHPDLIAMALPTPPEKRGFESWLASATRPRAIFEVAEKTFDADRNAKAKELGFRWVAEKKSWRRRLAKDDVAKLPFRVVEVRA